MNVASAEVGGSDPPAVLLDPSAASGAAPLKVSFHLRSDLPKPVTSWTLLYGDGLSNTKSGALPHFAGHTYSKPGTYDVAARREPRRLVARHRDNDDQGELASLRAWPRPSSEIKSSSSRSTRSPSAGTASRGSTASSSSCAAALPGDTVRARVTKVQRRHAEAIATEVAHARAAARRGAVRPLPGLRRLPLPGSRLRRAARGEGAVGRRLVPAPRRARRTRRSSRSSARRRSSTTATRWSTRSRQTDDGPALGLPPGRPLGRGARDRRVLADDRPRQRDPQPHHRVGARGEALRRTTRRRTRATSATSSSARDATPGRRSCSSSRRAASGSTASG